MLEKKIATAVPLSENTSRLFEGSNESGKKTSSDPALVRLPAVTYLSSSPLRQDLSHVAHRTVRDSS